MPNTFKNKPISSASKKKVPQATEKRSPNAISSLLSIIDLKILGLILLGITLRLIVNFAFTHHYDVFNILALGKSVADTGNLLEGFFVTKRIGLEIQLYGKVFYQLLAAWMIMLNKLHLIKLDMLFGVGAYNGDSENYMGGFYHFSPYLFEIMSIKLVQVIWDALFLFFFFKTAQLLELKNRLNIVLFWAVNICFVFVAYAMLMSDIAMMAFMFGGIYFGLKHIKIKNTQFMSTEKVLCLAFFAAGVVMKLVPALILPVFLILFSSSILSFFASVGIFGIFYILVSQPWTADSELIKHFFLNSAESMGVFAVQFNGIPLILLTLIPIYIIAFIWKKSLLDKPIKILYFAAIILSFVYLWENEKLLYPQFSIWIMPIMALISLENPIYTIFLITPVIPFIKRTILDSTYFTGGASVLLGSPLIELLSYRNFIHNFVNPVLFDYGFNTIFFLLYVSFIFLLLMDIAGKSLTERLRSYMPILGKITLKSFSITLICIYLAFLIPDFIMKSRFITIKSGVFESTNQELVLHKDPIIVYIDNPNAQTITAVDLRLERKKTTVPDNVILKFKDRDTKQLLFEQKVNDYTFPENKDFTTVILKKALKNKSIIMELSKEKGKNILVAYEVTKVPNKTYYDYGLSSFYESPKTTHWVDVSFPDKGIVMKVRAVYSIENALLTVQHHIAQRTKFFVIYFAMIGILAITTVALFISSRKRYSTK